MPQTSDWTIGRLLKWTADYLREQGADSPRLDAEVLLAEARGCQRIELYTAFAEIATERVRTAFRELVRRRAEGTPVAYLVGRRDFYSLSFRVTPEVLIPRPETEHLVVCLLDAVKEMSSDGRPVEIADVGTGSGIIAVCAAKHLPTCRVTAVDISPRALSIARANADKHGVAKRIDFHQGDLLAPVQEDRRFDFVVSNPPYVSEAEFAELPPDVKNHEPREALVAGPAGTEVIQRLITQAARRLRPRGRLIVEISPMIHEPVVQLIDSDGHYEAASTIKDLANLSRVVMARRQPV